MLLSVKAPTTYLADGPVEINDKFGEFFYAVDSGKYFNLPVGEYDMVSGSLIQDTHFQPFPAIPYQVDPKIAPGMHVEIGENPNKATYFANNNKAVIDTKIIVIPFKPARIFCSVHEKGHTRFRPPTGTMARLKNPFDKDYKKVYTDYLEAECNCDIYAYNVMVRNGYNPSQVMLAASLIFKPDNERLGFIHQLILEANNNKIV